MTKAAAPDPRLRGAIEAFQAGKLDTVLQLAVGAGAAVESANWQHLLGLTRCRLGDVEAGLASLRSAASSEPGNAAFQLMLCRALIDSGRASEVVAMPEPPPVTSAQLLALWQVRAEAADAAAEPQASAIAWGKVVAAAPRDWRAWSNLGNAYGVLRRWGEASDALLQAHRLHPNEPAVTGNAVAALLQNGRALQFQSQFDDAEAAFRAAYELAPTKREVVLQLGIALERANRLDELVQLLDKVSAAGLGQDQLPYLWAVLARREKRFAEARELLLKADPEEEPVRWHSLRAKLADALGDADEAFAAAVEMNKASTAQTVSTKGLEEWRRKSDQYRADLYELARLITPDWATKVPRLTEPMSRRLAFLLGFPRSGTTLLDTFLMGHPRVEVLEEKQLVGKAADVIGGSFNLAGAPIERLRKARTTYLGLLNDHVAADFSGLVVDKFPLDMAAAPIIDAVFPDAPLIFAQRHPCDVVLSGFMQPIGVVNFSNIEAAAAYYDAMMSIWTASREALKLNVQTVVYEEFVSDPEATLRPLIQFLGLEWDDRVLDHQRAARQRGTIATPSYDQVTEPVTRSAVGRWKRYAKQMEPALPVLLPWAEKLGYRD